MVEHPVVFSPFLSLLPFFTFLPFLGRTPTSAPPTFDFRGRRLCREKLPLYIKQSSYNHPSTDDALYPRNPSEGFRENHCENFIGKRKRGDGRTRGKTNRREMKINAQPARGNTDEIRIFKRYRAITFDAQFN